MAEALLLIMAVSLGTISYVVAHELARRNRRLPGGWAIGDSRASFAYDEAPAGCRGALGRPATISMPRATPLADGAAKLEAGQTAAAADLSPPTERGRTSSDD